MKFNPIKWLTIPIISLFIMAAFVVEVRSYEFIVYSPDTQGTLDSLGIDFGSPRWSPDSTTCLTNKNGNVSLSHSDLQLVKSLLDVQVIGSDSISTWLQNNGWNQ